MRALNSIQSYDDLVTKQTLCTNLEYHYEQ